MKKIYVAILLSSLFLASILNAGYQQETRVLSSTGVLQNMIKTQNINSIKNVLHNAKAIAVFPNTMKNAFFIGGRVGQGVMSIKDQNGKWSEPIFVDLKGLSLGIQFGFKATDIVLIFKTGRSLDSLTNGKITLGADVDAVAVRKGTKGRVKIDKKLEADTKSYSRSSGLYAGAALNGAVIHVSDNDNFDYYDDLIYLNDILEHDRVKEKPESEKFKQVLNSF